MVFLGMGMHLNHYNRDPQPRDPFPTIRLSCGEQSDLLIRHRSGDRTAYPKLIGSLMGLARHFAGNFYRQNRWADYDEILYDVLLPGVMRAIEKHDSSRPDAVELYSFVYDFLVKALYNYVRSRRAKMIKKTCSLDEPDGQGGNQTYLDRHALPMPTPEDIVMARSSLTHTLTTLKTLAGLHLTRQQRAILEKLLADPDGEYNGIRIAEAIGQTRQNVSSHRRNIQNRLRPVLIDEASPLQLKEISPPTHLLHHCLSDLDLTTPQLEQEQLRKLAGAGVIFTRDGHVDLRSAITHCFNTTIFRMADGTFKAGIYILRAKNCDSVFEFFKQCKISPELLIFPRKMSNLMRLQHVDRPQGYRSKRDTEFTPEEVATAIRMAPNLSQLLSMSDIEICDGRWIFKGVPARSFGRKWCAINVGGTRGLKGGPKLIRMAGIQQKNQRGIHLLLKLVFGDIDCVLRKRGPRACGEGFDQGQIISALQTLDNRTILARHGIRIQKDQCYVETFAKSFCVHCKLRMGDKKITARTVFRNLHLPENHEGLMAFCRLVFPNYPVVFIASGKQKDTGRMQRVA